MGPGVGQAGVPGKTEPERIARLHEISLGHRLGAESSLRKDVAGEERARRGVEKISGFPAVRNVRRVNPDELAFADGQTFAIVHCLWRTVRVIGDRYERGDATAERYGVRGRSEKLVQRTAFVRFEVRESDVAQAIDGHDPTDRFGHQRKRTPHSG